NVYRLGTTDGSWIATGQIARTLEPRTREFLLPNGTIFIAAPSDPEKKNYYYDPALDTISLAGDDPVPSADYESFTSTAVLLPVRPDSRAEYSSVRVLVVGGDQAHVKELGTRADSWSATLRQAPGG